MTNLLTDHPEINAFEADQKKMDPVVGDYLQQRQKTQRKVDKANQKFIEWISTCASPAEIDPVKLLNFPDCTYTTKQFNRLYSQLEYARDNYPQPIVLKNKIQPGKYLDLRSESDNQVFLNKLDTFLAEISNSPKPKKVEINLSQIGHIPARLLHEAGSEEFVDPMIGHTLQKIWTLDVMKNPGLSIKDVMAVTMVQAAFDDGSLTQDTFIVEGTSGNTGVGLALLAVHFGLRCLLIIPDKMSQEKIDRLRNLGSHVVVTPTRVNADDPKSYYCVRDRSSDKLKGWRVGQYDNLANRQAHLEITGPEIWEQTRGEVTALIATAGTCGTVSGAAQFLKKKNPNIKVVAVDTIGSVLYLLKEGYSIKEVEQYAKGYTIQGFGEDIHPQNLDLGVIDRFVRIGDMTGLNLARVLPSLGVFPGQSSGAAYATVLKLIAEKFLTPKDKVMVIFPDTGLPYRQDVYSDGWLKAKNLYFEK